MSLSRHSDTIVAPITALGGAVAVVRASGSCAWQVARRVSCSWPGEPEPRRAIYGTFSTGDDGLTLLFPDGASYTGEPVAEFSVHGSPASVSALMEACVAAGARPAEPGEFTLRAFMNGRLDLTQAEGVRDTVNARSEAQLRQASLLREGALRDAVHAVRDRFVSVLAAVEAATDFSEEVGELDRAWAATQCAEALSELDRLLASEPSSRLVREGATVVIAGRPNAGKSSLLNALLGSDRAIVTEVPGTTRDTIEECLVLDGIVLRLVDTAGLRQSDDPVESLGIVRSRDALACADYVLYVYDASRGWQAEDTELHGSLASPALVLANKCDLATPDRGLALSCTTGEGVPDAIAALKGLIGPGSREPGLLNRRHAASLSEAREAVSKALDTLRGTLPDDLATVDLQAAARALGEVTGETTPPDVIERIFAQFCIGK